MQYNVYWYVKDVPFTKEDFTPGASYKVTFNEGPKGGKYINAMEQVDNVPVSKSTSIVKGFPGEDVSSKARKIVIEPQSKRPTNGDDKMTKADWAAKDRRISRSGVVQAAVQAVAASGLSRSLDDLRNDSIVLAGHMLDWVNK